MMFIHASDPIALKSEIEELCSNLDYLKKKTIQIKNQIAIADNRNKQTMPVLLVREVNRLMSLGVPEDIAIEDAREALEMTKEAAYFAWHRAKSHNVGLNRYARIFACKQLKAKGFSRHKIAEMLDISTGSVDKYLKTELKK